MCSFCHSSFKHTGSYQPEFLVKDGKMHLSELSSCNRWRQMACINSALISIFDVSGLSVFWKFDSSLYCWSRHLFVVFPASILVYLVSRQSQCPCPTPTPTLGCDCLSLLAIQSPWPQGFAQRWEDNASEL